MSKWSANIKAVAKHFWGEPSKETKTELRFGSQGSKTVNLDDGTWYCFETEEGGGVVDLVKQQLPDVDVAQFLEDVIDLPKQSQDDQFEQSFVTENNTVYDYQDQEGNSIYQVVRYEPKTFRQRQQVNGKTVWNLQGVTLLPYRLPQIEQNKDKPVYIVEGEKDVLKLESLGILATCNSGGSGKWTKEHSQYLKGRDVVIIPDNDEPGKKHSRVVISSLQTLAKSIKLIELPGIKPKGDVFDWLENHSIKDLLDLVEQTKVLSDKPITPIPIMSIQEVMNMKPVPWLVQDYIPENSMSMLYGSPGSGKTFIALDMALHIAHNKPWHHKAINPGEVFYIAGEGVGGLRKRLKAWHIFHELEPKAPCHIIPQAVGLLKEQEMEQLIETITKISKDQVKLVIFDTVARCMSGDENSAQDIGDAIKAMDLIRNTFNCAVMPIHHSGKDRDRGARGSTALIGAVDVSMKVEKLDKLVGLVTEKQKDSEAEEALLFETHTIHTDELGLGDESSLIYQVTDQKYDKKTKLTSAQRETLEALRKAIEEQGTYPGGSVPGKAVSEKVWREYAFRRSITASESVDAKRKAFARSAKSLLEIGQIDKFNDWCWDKVDMMGQKENVPLKDQKTGDYWYGKE